MIFVRLLCFRGVFVVVVVGDLLGVVWCGVGPDCKCGVGPPAAAGQLASWGRPRGLTTLRLAQNTILFVSTDTNQSFHLNLGLKRHLPTDY